MVVQNEKNNIVDQFIQVELVDQKSFSRIREVLTRIGIPSFNKRKLFQSAHILHKMNKYYIVHFKEMFLLDGKTANMTSDDYDRRSAIAQILQQWGLLRIVTPVKIVNQNIRQTIMIVSRQEKQNWELVAKYQIGKTSKKD